MPSNLDEERLERIRKIFDGEEELPPVGRMDADVLTAFSILLDKALERQDYKEAMALIKKANGIVLEEEKTLTEKAREWVLVSTGSFTVSEICRALGFVRKEDAKERNVIRQEIHRLKKTNTIESFGNRNDVYRLIEQNLEPMDFKNAPTAPLPVVWPLMEDGPMFNIYSGNIAVVAGNFNAGKTAYLLAFTRLNMEKFKINYYSSEMGSSELRIRLQQFENIELHEWDFEAFERSDFFQDVVDSGKITIIDFLEVSDAFYQVAGMLTKIHDKLRGGKGIALVALQKPPGRDLGRGGAFSAEKPRVYLSIESGVIKIVKAKNFHGDRNPNGMKRNFSLFRGAKFEPRGEWYRDV